MNRSVNKTNKTCPNNTVQYVVKSGDTLYKIATRNKTSIEVLLELNPELNTSLLIPGIVMCIPANVSVPSTTTPGTNLPTTKPSETEIPPEEMPIPSIPSIEMPTQTSRTITMPSTPMQPTMPSTPMQPTMPSTGTPTMPSTGTPTHPTMPSTPMQPTMPGTPMQPTMPSTGTPTQPMMPGTPTQPTMPSTSRPMQPTMPGTPTQPTMPSTPMQPTMPSTPMQPTMPSTGTPMQPTMPYGTPMRPMMPSTSTPMQPMMPSTPMQQVIPVSKMPMQYNAPSNEMPMRPQGWKPLFPSATEVTCNEQMRYTIRNGDTLYNIARRYDLTLFELLNANKNVNPYNLQVGQVICIPMSSTRCPFGKVYTIASEDTLATILTRFRISLANLKEVNENFDPYNIKAGTRLCIPAFIAYENCPTERTYVIQNGDNLNRISENLMISISDLLVYNPNMRPDDFTFVGTSICLPAEGVPLR